MPTSARIETNKSKVIIALFLILVIVFITFSPSLKNGFVNWDDDRYVSQNTVLQSLSLKNFQKIWTSFFIGHYQPLTMLSYWSEYYFFRLNPFYYHLTNLILHLLNCLLVFWLIFLLTDKIYVSWIV